ncbi:unnamed protein product, partial [Brassica oleracea]
MSLSKNILIAFVFTLFFSLFLHNFNIVLFLTIRIDFGVKQEYKKCYGPCE